MNDDIQKLKRRAKAMVRDIGIPHQKALDILARREGHATWGSLLQDLRNVAALAAIEPVGTATGVRGVSIALLIEALLSVMNALVQEADEPDTYEDGHIDEYGLYVDDEGEMLPFVRIEPDGAAANCGLTHDQGHLLQSLSEELRRISNVIPISHTLGMLMIHGEFGWHPASFELRGDNGAVWTSRLLETGYDHHLHIAGRKLTDDKVSNTPENWRSASEWAIGYTDDGIGNKLDPNDWGFRPSGLFLAPMEPFDDYAVCGCRYEVDPVPRTIVEGLTERERRARKTENVE